MKNNNTPREKKVYLHMEIGHQEWRFVDLQAGPCCGVGLGLAGQVTSETPNLTFTYGYRKPDSQLEQIGQKTGNTKLMMDIALSG